MKTITFATDPAGKVSIFLGPEAKTQEHRAARFAAREQMPDGVVRLETYRLDATNRVGAVTAKAAPEDAAPQKPDSLADKKVDELREIATSLGIAAAGLKKAELIEAIEARQAQ